MFDQLISVFPCSDWESAASLGDRALGGPPLVLRGQYIHRHEFAYGTVSWPLKIIAQIGNGFYGTAKTIRATRSLVNYCALSLGAGLRKKFVDDVTNGVGSDMHTDLHRTVADAPTLSMSCPRCEEQVWSEFGMRAKLWPHQAPFVEACALDGCMLQPWVPGGAPPSASGHRHTAAAAKIAFAKDVMELARVTEDPCALASSLNARLQELELLESKGIIKGILLSKLLHAYVEAHYHGTAVQRIMVFPRACQVVRAFLYKPFWSVPPHFLVVLYAFLRDADQVYRAGDYSSVEKRKGAPWRPKTCDPPWPSDAEEPYDPVELLKAGFSRAAVIKLCGMTPGQVVLCVNRTGIAAQVKRARKRVVRKLARDAWMRLLKESPGRSTTVLEVDEQALCHWLKRNDRAWMDSTRYGCRRSVVVALPDHARALSATDVLATMPHLEKVIRGVRDRRCAKEPRKAHALTIASGIPKAQFKTLCEATPALNREVQRILQCSTITWSSDSESKHTDKAALKRGTSRNCRA